MAAGQDAPPAGVEGPVRYEARIEGRLPSSLETLLTESSQLVALEDRPPASLSALERRAVADVARLETALRSEGFYDGEVAYRIEAERRPVLAVLEVHRGRPYRLAAFEVRYAGDEPPPDIAASAESLGLTPGERARAPEVVAAQDRLLGRLAESGRPLATLLDRRAVIDRSARVLNVTLTVDPGPAAVFGPLEVSGLEKVEEGYVRRLRPWQQGQPYDRRAVDAYRQDLLGTRLFETVTLMPADRLDEHGALDVILRVKERPQRSIGSGASYGTGEGGAVWAFWEHRNLLGEDEDLRVETRVGEIEQRLAIDFRKPRFRRPDQDLLGAASLKREDTDAFEDTTLAAAVALERRFGEAWRGRLGISAELTEVRDAEDERDLLLLGLPGSLARDTRDDPLDPARGSRLELGLIPYLGTLDESLGFLVTTLSSAAYRSLSEEDGVVLAARARIGTILGPGREDVPASKRFYAGGGGSIRGYEFQKLGALDEQGDPLGGRSIVELGTELRLRLGQRFGLVPFVDGGAVFTDAGFSGGDETLRWAWGLGLRYYTAVGPLRLDFAFPLDKREGVDEDFQFYLSFGQAF